MSVVSVVSFCLTCSPLVSMEESGHTQLVLSSVDGDYGLDLYVQLAENTTDRWVEGF